MDVLMLLGLRPRRLAAIIKQPPTLLTAASGLYSNFCWSSLYSIVTDPKENTASKTSSIVMRVSFAAITSLARGVFAVLFPSNGCL
jgi:hypothetical protein